MARIARFEENISQARDLCGANPDVHTFDQWVVQGAELSPGEPLPVSNALRARLAGVASFALDLSRMRLRADAPLGLEIETDGPLDLRLRAPWPGPVWDGAREHAPQEDVLTLRIERSGRTELRGASAPR